MTSTRLTSIELQGFRGFTDAQAFDLDADVVLVRRDNGTGKTSLIDGIAWLFTGELGHLSERVRGSRRIEDPVVNRYAEGPARVSLSVQANGSRWDSNAPVIRGRVS